MKEIKDELSKVLKTGKILIGSKEVIEGLLHKDPKLILLSKTCPLERAERIKYYSALSDIPCLAVEERSLELGKKIEKPFQISALGIIKEGESKILDIAKR